eukprot:scaffold8206_cov135-Cylindrotheca_fusiformis.AAC.4
METCEEGGEVVQLQASICRGVVTDEMRDEQVTNRQDRLFCSLGVVSEHTCDWYVSEKAEPHDIHTGTILMSRSRRKIPPKKWDARIGQTHATTGT